MKPNILVFDIETSNLVADFGSMLSFASKRMGAPQNTTKVISIQDTNGVCSGCQRVENPSNDKALLEAVYDTLAEADGWITWYGKGFDEKFLQSRYLYHKLPILPPVYHIDGWATARSKLKIHSNRLKSVQDFFGIKDGKTALLPEMWQDARAGGIYGLSYVAKHNVKDVIVLEKAYLRLRPLISNHPNWNHWVKGSKMVCPICGGPMYFKPGEFHYTKRAVNRLGHCLKCGKWDIDPKPVKKRDLPNQ
jgi:uncharacterized protein YprB with RNaseH-like and TPR domain